MMLRVLVILAMAASALLTATPAQAQSPRRPSAPAEIAPQVRSAVARAKRSHEALGWQGRALDELSRQLVRLRTHLHWVAATEEPTALDDATGLLEAHAVRLRSLYRAALLESESHPAIHAGIAAKRDRLEAVVSRVEAIAGTADPAARRSEARALLSELVAEDPRANRRKLRPSSFHFKTLEGEQAKGTVGPGAR